MAWSAKTDGFFELLGGHFKAEEVNMGIANIPNKPKEEKVLSSTTIAIPGPTDIGSASQSISKADGSTTKLVNG